MVAYFASAFFWRSFIVWKQTGINPVVLKQTDSAHDFIGRVFKILFATIVMVVLVYSFWPSAYQYFVPIVWLERSWLIWSGIALLLLSLIWTVLAQAQMGESWRIGIDEEYRTPLVTSGVFGWSRNPIFVGMKITLLGLFLIIPNPLTLPAFVMGVVLIQIEVRLEKDFLGRTHGEDYKHYRHEGQQMDVAYKRGPESRRRLAFSKVTME
jgi:protein-S-isoprenylcysteine O-methyltransferase Ste14